MFKYGEGGQGSSVRRDGSIVKRHFGTRYSGFCSTAPG